MHALPPGPDPIHFGLLMGTGLIALALEVIQYLHPF